jgi:hypothetical protein
MAAVSTINELTSEVEVLADLIDQGIANNVFRFEQLLYDATGGGDNDVVIPQLTPDQIVKVSSNLTPDQVSGLVGAASDYSSADRFETILYDATGGGENGKIIPELTKDQIVAVMAILTPQQVTGLIKEANYQIGIQRISDPAGWIDLDDAAEGDDVEGDEQD